MRLTDIVVEAPANKAELLKKLFDSIGSSTAAQTMVIIMDKPDSDDIIDQAVALANGGHPARSNFERVASSAGVMRDRIAELEASRESITYAPLKELMTLDWDNLRKSLTLIDLLANNLARHIVALNDPEHNLGGDEEEDTAFRLATIQAVFRKIGLKYTPRST
jgi:hypothetical protein